MWSAVDIIRGVLARGRDLWHYSLASMPHFNRRPPFPKTSVQTVDGAGEPPKRVKQTVEAFLVLDVEATCKQGTDFDYPNEIIVRFYSPFLSKPDSDPTPR
jgi:hypothetical protein